jgi:hypothetical protein
MFEPEHRDQKEPTKMSDHKTHDQHPHAHGSGCGHTAIKHEGHVDYLHDGHLHSAHQGHVDEHALTEGGSNPAACTPTHACGEHDAKHSHGAACGHEAIPHGGHTDHLVKGHLHHAHQGHCDDHGAVSMA